MKLKLTVYTDPQGQKHYITHFEVSGLGSYVRSKELLPDGSVGTGPRLLWEELPGHKESKCEEIEVEFSIP